MKQFSKESWKFNKESRLTKVIPEIDRILPPRTDLIKIEVLHDFD